MNRSGIRIGLFSQEFHNPHRRGMAVYSHRLVEALALLPLTPEIRLIDYFLPRSNLRHLPVVDNPRFGTSIIRWPGRLFEFFNTNLGWPSVEHFSGHLDLLHVLHERLPESSASCKVVTVHGMAVVLRPELYTERYRRKWQKSLDRALRGASRVIAVSRTVADMLNMYRPEYANKYRVTLLGISREFLAEPDREFDSKVLASCGIDFPYVLLVGAADPQKNLLRFMEAVAITFARFTDRAYHVVFAGDPEWGGFDEVRLRIAELGLEDCVHFTGYLGQRELASLYRSAWLFAFPALFEGFGLPLLEAQASGAACLASDLPIFRDVGGECVEYVDPESVEDIAFKLERLLLDRERLEHLQASGRKRAREFTWERTARETLRVYEELLGTSILGEPSA